MHAIEEIRRMKLSVLAQEAGSQAALARKVDKDSNQINQWLGKGAVRNMDSEAARMFERVCGKPYAWMDNLSDSEYFTPEEFELLIRYRTAPAAARAAILGAARATPTSADDLNAALIGSARASLDTPPEISMADLIRKLRPHPDHLAQLEAMGVIPRSKVSTSESEADQHRTKIQRKSSG